MDKKEYVRIGAGPSLGGRGTVVKLRERNSSKERTVSFSVYKKLCEKGLIVKLAYIAKVVFNKWKQ